MKRDDFPAPREGLVLTHFLSSNDVERSRAFYSGVLGGEVILEKSPASSSWRTAGSSSTKAAGRRRTMALERGTRLGPYQIESPIGAGKSVPSEGRSRAVLVNLTVPSSGLSGPAAALLLNMPSTSCTALTSLGPPP